MIFTNALAEKFQEKGLAEQAQILENYLENTFLTPNELHVNTVSLSFLRSNSQLFGEILQKLNPEQLSSNIDNVFLNLLNLNSQIITSNIILKSTSSFLSILCGAIIYGFMKEAEVAYNVSFNV